MSILNFIILYSDRIIISKNIDVIRPFIIAMVIIKDTGQSIFINRKYPIMPKLPTQQPNKHRNVFLDAWDALCLQYQQIINVLSVDIKPYNVKYKPCCKGKVKKLMNIGKASKLSDLTVKTVRYYANIELVKPKQSNFTGYREYSEEDVLKLKFVGKARKFNFSIEECRELLSLYENENRSSKEVKKITLEKICEIDKKLKELKDLRNELSYLANNCHGDDRPNCPILEALSKS